MKKFIYLMFFIPCVSLADTPPPDPELVFQNIVTNLALIETTLAYCKPTKDEQRVAEETLVWVKSRMTPTENRRLQMIYEDRIVAVKSKVLSKGATAFCDSYGVDVLETMNNDRRDMFPMLQTKKGLKGETPPASVTTAVKDPDELPVTQEDYTTDDKNKEFGIGIFDKATKRSSGE